MNRLWWLLLSFVFSSFGQAQQTTTSAPNLNDPALPALREAYQALQKGDFDGAIAKATTALQANPKSLGATMLRGSAYYQKKQWTQAEQDFDAALQIDPSNVPCKFNLAELKFAQKEYDQARADFDALRANPDLTDLAAYKVFLCDLFGGHDKEASDELEAFNRVGSNPSYYYGNAAWSLTHNKTEDARGWLISAVNIYSPQKNNLYAASLTYLGYLPLPSPPPEH